MIITTTPGCFLHLGSAGITGDFSATSVVAWTDALYDTDGFYDLCASDGQIDLPDAFIGHPFWCMAALRVNGISTTATSIIQIAHRDACGAAKWAPTSDVYYVGGITDEQVCGLSPVGIASGDYVEVVYDSGSDTSVTLEGDAGPTLPSSCYFVLAILPKFIGT